ncbi:uncharacterized protein [Coffea arabica]|uniref:CCHC-type domain-containing protein n=1 Tax=Coffea arabica TaxID=13443 RepID=A0ABM4WPC4_COFAR
MPQEPEPNVPATARNAYKKHMDDNRDSSCIMVASMIPQLQQQHMKMGAYDIVQHLRELFEQQSRTVRYDTSKELFRCKMAEGAPAAPHVLKIIGLIEKLAELGFKMDQELNMNNLQHTLPQLLNVLKTAEKEIKKGKGPTNALVVFTSKKRKKQGKGFKNPTNKPVKKPKKAKADQSKATCFHCGQTGHWKRNCKAYLESLKQKKLAEASSPGTYMIEINSLKDSRQLGKNEITLRIGNGAKVATLAVGTYYIALPSGLILELSNSRGGFSYFITFTDDHSRYDYVYLMKYKSESFEKFKKFRNEVEKQTEFILERDSGSRIDLEEIQDHQTNIEQPVEEQLQPHNDGAHTEAVDIQGPHRSVRVRSAPKRYEFLMSQSNDILVIQDDKPTTYQEVLDSPDSSKWLEAMNFEMNSMYDNKIWTLVDPPEGIKPVRCKWVFKKKTDMEGNVITYKARLVAKGYKQKEGIN